MFKVIGGFVAGVIFIAAATYNFMGSLMFREVPSPYGVEETVARIQQNIQNVGNGWALQGLRNPVKPLEADGGNALPVLMIEACSTKYSGPILNDDAIRFLSILMPCKISVYKKNDGKTYIGLMNAGLVGRMFGAKVGEVMEGVAEDQAKFIVFDPDTPAPAMIKNTPAASGGSSGGGAAGGC
ncbi:MAG: DUF302 domain-containing protein [Hydrogenophaga sp.]|nr:DUF302 domain-containing protein [Gammaproteobacteria bacterium]